MPGCLRLRRTLNWRASWEVLLRQLSIHMGPVGVNNNVEAHNSLEYYKDYFVIYGRRFAEKGVEIFDQDKTEMQAELFSGL